ncbi:hypothetical protein FXO38_35563 [Capsicum annuum]|nr:hypothetical protein FXO38_35563 [Capsicum annuum]KAF3632567.1 hypothetical protein FXO37_27399 [Capsicum annuum]
MGNLGDVVDPKQESAFNEKEMKHLLIVGLSCAHPESNCRPFIRRAIHVLNFEAPLLAFHPKKPVPTANCQLPTYCIRSQYLPPYDTNGPEITLTHI